MWVFPFIPILGIFFRLKIVEKCVCVVELKIALLLVKSVFISVKKGMGELKRRVAAKQAAFLLNWICNDQRFKIRKH